MSSFALPHPTEQPDVLIVGAGIIGLSLALELYARGAKVTVLERDRAMSHASSAAAGMLAANDPHNPPALRELSQYSVSLYSEFLERIERLTGQGVPYQTDITIQHRHDGGFDRLNENSIDPRQLASALIAAIRSTSIRLVEHEPVLSLRNGVAATANQSYCAGHIVRATGAWSAENYPVSPRKGQMVRVKIPAGVGLREVHRDEHIYVVPRTSGPQAGTALIGATVEDAGYNTDVRDEDLAALRHAASAFVAELGSEELAPQVEAWAGLRPATADLLPVLGFAGESEHASHFLATGHFRNGILLAPATAAVIADLIVGKQPAIDLAPFSPQREGLLIPAQASR